ncbi:MAG: hypothetical protein GEV07_09165 [Streptosporangiales bacterium]|nr:hypothetical protein [Streptosporangiales bacterium]
MLDPGEAAAVAARFGVAEPQVERDHLISHLLAALGRRLADWVVFFGGTALARAYLPEGRLSEDIDLLARGASRTQVAAELETELPRPAPAVLGRPGSAACGARGLAAGQLTGRAGHLAA